MLDGGGRQQNDKYFDNHTDEFEDKVVDAHDPQKLR